MRRHARAFGRALDRLARLETKHDKRLALALCLSSVYVGAWLVLQVAG